MPSRPQAYRFYAKQPVWLAFAALVSGAFVSVCVWILLLGVQKQQWIIVPFLAIGSAFFGTIFFLLLTNLFRVLTVDDEKLRVWTLWRGRKEYPWSDLRKLTVKIQEYSSGDYRRLTISTSIGDKIVLYENVIGRFPELLGLLENKLESTGSIFDDPTVGEVREDFVDALSRGANVEEAARRVLSDGDDAIAYLALAALHVERGELQSDVRERALEVIANGELADRWQKLGPNADSAWRRHLDDLNKALLEHKE